MRFTLSRRVREIELRLAYPDKESLAEAIKAATVQAAQHATPGGNGCSQAEHRLIELVRYAGRSGLLHER